MMDVMDVPKLVLLLICGWLVGWFVGVLLVYCLVRCWSIAWCIVGTFMLYCCCIVGRFGGFSCSIWWEVGVSDWEELDPSVKQRVWVGDPIPWLPSCVAIPSGPDVYAQVYPDWRAAA